ncbi:hypothetical protein Ancab_019655, partial [Ancistrocladus abbreviatus]
NIMNYRTYIAQFILARRYMVDGPGNTAAKIGTLKNAFDWLSNEEEAGGSGIDMEQIMSNQSARLHLEMVPGQLPTKAKFASRGILNSGDLS